jgi:hypothetical protein
MTPAEDVVEAWMADLLSTAQEVLAIAEPSADAPNLEEGDDIMFEHLLSADERTIFDKYSETIRELKENCKNNNSDFEKILDDAIDNAIIYEDIEKLTEKTMEKIEDKRYSKRNKIKDEIGKNLKEKFSQTSNIPSFFKIGGKEKEEYSLSSKNKTNNKEGRGNNKPEKNLTLDEKKLINNMIEEYMGIRNSTYHRRKSFYRSNIEEIIENIEKKSQNSLNQAKEDKNKISQDELLEDFENFCRDVISKIREKQKDHSSYNSEFFPEDLIHENLSESCPSRDIVIDDEKPASKSFRKQIEKVEEQIANITGESTSTRTQGTTPGGEETIINARFGIHTRMKLIFESLRSKLDGTTRSRLTSHAEHSKIPPISALGRVSDIPLPGREPIASYSVLVLDTSGSINEHDLSCYAIPAICSLFASNSTHIILIQYDADLQRECLIEPEQRHNLMKALESYKGRGGTAMENALLYVYKKFIKGKINEKREFKELKDKINYSKVNTFLEQNRQQPDKIVVITDGVTGYDAPGLEGWIKTGIPLVIVRFYEHGNWPEKIPHYRVDISDVANITYSRYDPRGQAMSL